MLPVKIWRRFYGLYVGINFHLIIIIIITTVVSIITVGISIERTQYCSGSVEYNSNFK